MSSVDIGIDLGTANIIITLGGKGIVLNEPSVVAYDKKKRQVIAVGGEAYKMLGRTPEYIIAACPLREGVISDNYMTEIMIREFVRKVSGNMLIKPRIAICVPSFVTDVERRALVETAMSAGARKVYLIEEPVAALLGAGIDITKPNGVVVGDIGGGTTDIAVASFNGIVSSASVKVGGNRMDAAIIKHMNSKYKLIIGEKTAEAAKKAITNVYDPDGTASMAVKGRGILKGLPQSLEINDMDIQEALTGCIEEVIAAIRSVLEKTPPELVGDIHTNGVVLTGGGALLGGLDRLITSFVGAPCIVAGKPAECVARGVGIAFKHAGELLDGFEKISFYKYK
ncbi:MAG: rod shape-determining protein [Oscillospiraceae bacterium]|jgi:rod shape-determining protein MreB|nr:rod shape-determining protein [Oscillospiraceae bacterium]